MKQITFIKDYATAKKGDTREFSSILCSTLVKQKVAKYKVKETPKAAPKAKAKVKKAE